MGDFSKFYCQVSSRMLLTFPCLIWWFTYSVPGELQIMQARLFHPLAGRKIYGVESKGF